MLWFYTFLLLLVFFLSTPIFVPRHVPFCFSVLSFHRVILPPVHTQVLQKQASSSHQHVLVFWYSSWNLHAHLLRPPPHLSAASSSSVWSGLCALWGSIPHGNFLLPSLSLATSNLVYVLWPDGSYYSLHITTIQGLPAAYKIQIPDPGILGHPGELAPVCISNCLLQHSFLSNWTTPYKHHGFLSSSPWHILSLPGMSLFILFLSSSSAILSRFRAMTLLLQSLWILPSFEVLYHLNCSSFVVSTLHLNYHLLWYYKLCTVMSINKKAPSGGRSQTQLSYSAP